MSPAAAEDVIRFLEENPRFFIEHPELLRASGLLGENSASARVLNLRQRLFDRLKGEREDLNDSLFVVGFGLRTPRGEVIPLTLALRFQRVGPTGFAVQAAEPFIDVIADYFGVVLSSPPPPE